MFLTLAVKMVFTWFKKKKVGGMNFSERQQDEASVC